VERNYETSVLNPIGNELDTDADGNEITKHSGSGTFSLNSLSNTTGNANGSKLIKTWSMQVSQKYHRKSINRTNKEDPDFIEVSDKMYTITTQQVVNLNDNLFARAIDPISNGIFGDMTYNEAKQRISELNLEKVQVREIVNAAPSLEV
jgi:hypothetical protein